MPDLWLVGQTAVSGLGTGCIFGLIGIGYCMIYQTSGIVNFAQGVFFMLGGMLTHLLWLRLGLSLIVAAPLAIALVAGIGMLIELLLVRPLWQRKADLFVIILATLAAQIAIEGVTVIALGDAPRTFPPIFDVPPLKIAGLAINVQILCILAAALLSVAGLHVFYRFTQTGQAMRACAMNREGAALLGIPVQRMLSLSFAMSAAFGALAGILITPTQFVAFNVGLPFGINGFIAAIIGGFGNAGGALLGGVLLGLAQALAVSLFGASVKDATAITILLLLLMFRPSGLFPQRSAA